jgi:hypothetical protein
MKSKSNLGLRRWGLSLVLALTVNLSLWSLAATGPDAAIRANLHQFGALQWKTA